MEEKSCLTCYRLRELGGCGRRGREGVRRGRKGARRCDSPIGGSGRGRIGDVFRAQLVQRFGKISARKPRYLMTRASFWRVIAGCFSVVGRIPRSGLRSIRERRTARVFPVGYLGFRAKICLGGLYYFRLARHSDSEEQLALLSVRFACLLPEATPYGYRAAILRMPCNLDASSSIPISSSAW